ncbi:MAG: hypothetical protein K0R71_419 [Bacillales bacterium]|jgi:aryl-alcohol dehydrogenase-like predicted oxidoreductase|nr:hypothetical protein [Bacillales bacterium]
MIRGKAKIVPTERILSGNKMMYKNTPWFAISSIGLGTHLGEMNETDSELYQESMEYALLHGINHIDTAVNYRGMRSERDVGKVLTKLISENKLSRDEVVIASKGGLLPGDIESNLHPTKYYEKLIDEGIIKESDFQTHGTAKHSLSPKYFEYMLELSRKNLNVETIDIYYVHRLEISLLELEKDEFLNQVEILFGFLEKQVNEGKIQFYGIASWDEFRVEKNDSKYLSIEELVNIARKIAGAGHHFRFVQAPFNNDISEIVNLNNQVVNGNTVNTLKAANELGMYVVTSAPLMCGRLTGEQYVPEYLLKPILDTPKILATLIGMKSVKNTKKNIKLIAKF